MKSVIDHSLVGLVLILSTGYAITSLGPRSLRPRLWGACGRLLAGLPPALGLGGLSRRLSNASHVKAGGACGGCDNCGAPTLSSPIQSAPPAEVRIPLAKIGRRA